jgi:double zinc ribbon protein
MTPLAYFGIESSGLNLVVDLLILFVVVLYLALIYWTYSDARRRIEDPMLVGCATAAALFPFVGTVVYMVLRPPEHLEDVRERELETETSEARLAELQTRRCPHCEHPIESDFLRCPNCLRKLKERCANCSRPLDRAWAICPYCETEVAGGATARRGARRRAAAGGDAARSAVRAPADKGAERELTGIGPGSARAGRRADDEAPRTPMAASEAARNPRPGRAPRPGGSPAPGS